MTGGRLPDGVPFDNQTLFGADETADPATGETIFNAPDMATPAFARPQPRTSPASDCGEMSKRMARVIVAVEDEDDEEDDEAETKDEDVLVHGPHAPATFLILIAIGLVLAALAAYVLSSNQEPRPYCSQQPDWNQYDCIPG